MEWVFIDGSIVRAHLHCAGAATLSNENIGTKSSGNSTKIHLAVDSGGTPIYFELSEGQKHDIKHAPHLVENLKHVDSVIADKSYDSDAFRQFITAKGGTSVIPKRHYKNTHQEKVDWCLYRYRHLVENAFGKIKHYQSISKRYEKLALNYAIMVSLVFTLMWLPMYF